MGGDSNQINQQIKGMPAPDIKESSPSNPKENILAPVKSAANALRFRAFLVYIALVVLVFLFPLIDLVTFAATRQYYNHILLVPFISLYLIREKRSHLSGPWKTSMFPAVAFAAIAVASMAFLYSGVRPMYLSDHYAVVGLSFFSFILAGAFLCFGADTLRKIAFPLAFLVFAIPMPEPIMHWIQIQLQHASAEAAYWMLSLMNVPMLRDGVDFKLPGIPIRVAEECSGFNSSYVLFMVSLLGGYLFLKSPWKRAFLSAAVIPLAIVRNGFRITTIAMMCTYIGPEMIHSPIHHRGGPVFFALSLIPFLALVWLLRRSESKTDSKS
jgi:exosortase C (VPDSG-CTERM-specific)